MRVEAAIVSYNPAPSLLTLVTDLVAAGIPVEVVDNASTSGADVLEECAAAGATLTLLSTNTGVAGALNHALESTTAEWLLTFDQDSVLTAHTLEQLLGSPATGSERVAIVAPVVRHEATARPLQGDPGRREWYETDRAITSGSLCRVDALRAVGGFRTDLVIDFVDWDLCLRLRKAGWRIAIEPTAVIEHSIGRASTHRVPLIGEVSTSNHTADRQYYKYRNYLLLARSGQLAQEPRWSARTAFGLGLGVGKVLAFESDRGAKLAAIAAGVRDGFAGRGGTRRVKPGSATPRSPEGVLARHSTRLEGERPPVSVCMATYNGARYLRPQLDSILAQLEADDELLVQDDGSSDDTVEILRSYGDPRIQLVANERNLGVISTFERCLARARHDIVFLADQDDEWLPGKLDAMVAHFLDPHVTGVVTDALIVDADNAVTGDSIFPHFHSGPGVLHNFVKNSYLGCCMAVRRDVLAVALPVPRSVRTHDGWIGITADMLGEVVFLPTPYVRYRRHGANLSPMDDPFGLTDVARRRLALAAHLARIAPTVLRRRAARAR
ncbi:MAG TPA: glycosyltransferase [Propionibacteriaceae bacterium]